MKKYNLNSYELTKHWFKLINIKIVNRRAIVTQDTKERIITTYIKLSQHGVYLMKSREYDKHFAMSHIEKYHNQFYPIDFINILYSLSTNKPCHNQPKYINS